MTSRSGVHLSNARGPARARSAAFDSQIQKEFKDGSYLPQSHMDKVDRSIWTSYGKHVVAETSESGVYNCYVPMAHAAHATPNMLGISTSRAVLSAWTNDNVKRSNAIRDLNLSSNPFTYASRDIREIAE
ncbi:hypothetical protein E4U17_003960 [Claviceps sp. LM77 group G4]|nr:hypothetical protein E4U17_003960 [Claviceps sp. LM77 group G4]